MPAPGRPYRNNDVSKAERSLVDGSQSGPINGAVCEVGRDHLSDVAFTASGPMMVLLSAMSPGPKWSRLPEITCRLSTDPSEPGVTASASAGVVARVGNKHCRWYESDRLGYSRLRGDRGECTGSESGTWRGHHNVGDEALAALDDCPVGLGDIDQVLGADETDAEGNRRDRRGQSARAPADIGQRQAAPHARDQQQRQSQDEFCYADEQRPEQRNRDQEGQAGGDGEGEIELDAEGDGHYEKTQRTATAEETSPSRSRTG